MSRKEEPFVRLPIELAEQYGYDVAGTYATLLDAYPRGTTTVKVRQEWLAKKGNMSISSVKRVLKKLEELGLVTKKKGIRASTYTITPVIRLKGEWKQDKQEEEQAESEKRKYRKKPFRTPEEERERQIELDKYLDLIN